MPVVVMYMPSALPCSTTLVSPPTIATPARARGVGHRAHLGLEHLGRQPGLEHERRRPAPSARAPRHGQIVHRAVDRQLADRAAGKAQRRDDEAVGGDRDARCRRSATRAASPSGSGATGAEEQRREQAFDEPAAGLAAGAVRHLDLRVAEADLAASRRRRRLPSGRRQHPQRCRRPCGVRSCSTLRMSLPTKPSARPPGARACTRVPNSLHCAGFSTPLSTSPHWAALGSVTRTPAR